MPADYGDILSPNVPQPQQAHVDYSTVPGQGGNPDNRPNVSSVRPSEQDEVVLYKMFRDWFSMDSAHSNTWRTKARQEFDFVASEQWDPADKRELEDSGRVAITFNRTLSIIKSVAGVEINGRHETTYLPRDNTTASAEINEMLTEASNWMADGCDAEDEQSDAFQDCCICGMGWTETRLDFEEDPEGKYIEERVDPLEMVWDNSARAKNLTDARRIWRVKKMMLSEARERFPGVPDVELDAAWARQMGMMSDPAKPVEERLHRDENLKFDYDPKTEVHIVQVQWWERETYWRVIDPQNPSQQPLELTPPEYERLQQRYDLLDRELIALELRRRVYKQAFLGGSILSGVKPAPVRDRFTFQCITGERDRNRGTWFGLVRLMHDPQMWANKWLSQSLHILNSTAKGGILAEEDAFVDQREAEESYAQADAITWARKDAIKNNKIMQKPGAGMPTAYINLLQFAISSIRDVVGINLELLGQRDVNQPGILEAQRKQAAMTILATLFDSLRRFRKQIGRIRLYFIQNYLSDGRWIRINDEEGFKFVQLLRDKTLGTYDVIVDDAPTSPNQKEKSWQIIQAMLPAIRDILTPETVLMILEYSPLPSKLVSSLKESLKNPDPQAQQMQQLEMAKVQGELQKLAGDAQRSAAAAEKDKAEAALKAAEAQFAGPRAAGEMQQLQAGIEKTQADTAAQEANTSLNSLIAQQQIAAIEKEQAAAANLRAKTILDFASAANETQTGLLNAARKSYLEAEAENSGLAEKGEDLERKMTGGLLEALEGKDDDFLPSNGLSMNLPTVPTLPTVPMQGGGEFNGMPPYEIGAGAPMQQNLGGLL